MAARMAAFVYFLPARQGSIPAAQIVEAGLHHILDPRRQFTANECREGPSGHAGLVIADTKTVHRIGYYDQMQEWCRVPGVDPCCWVGFDKSDPPDPALDLMRSRFLEGNALELGDEHPWFVPIVRGWILPDADDEGSPACAEMLPRAWSLDRLGKISGSEICSDLRHINGLGLEYLEYLGFAKREVEADSDPGEFPRLRQGAVDLLAANYTVSAAELVLIHALDDQYAVQVLNAAIDLDRILEWIKKKRRRLMRSPSGNGSTTRSGSEDSAAAIGQHSATLLPTPKA